MSGFLHSIANLFNFGPSSESSKLLLSDKLKEYRVRINKIIDDLIDPYLHPSESGVSTSIGLVDLLDAKKCNDYAIYLSDNIEQNFTELEVEEIGEKIFVSHGTTPGCKGADCNKRITASNIKGNKGSYSKKQLCDSIAIHHIKLLNLIASILAAVNPTESMSLKRMRRLYFSVSSSSPKRLVKVMKILIPINQ